MLKQSRTDSYILNIIGLTSKLTHFPSRDNAANKNIYNGFYLTILQTLKINHHKKLNETQ